MQVFKLERRRTNALGETEQEVHYGITSLPTSLATPKRLLTLVRTHWGIEMACIISGIVPWMKIDLNYVWDMLLTYRLCSILQLSACSYAEERVICLGLNAVLTINLRSPWQYWRLESALQQPNRPIENCSS